MTRPALRIAHLADTHLGYRAAGKTDPVSGRNQRAVDIERAFEAAIDDLLRRGVDLVLHAGDVFHHTRPSWSTVGAFVRAMRRLERAGVPTLVIAGNHDTPRLRTSGSVYQLLQIALPEIRFVAGYEEKGEEFPDLDLVVHAIPHGALQNPDPPLVLPDPARRNVMVTHGLAPGVELRGGREPGEERLGAHLLDPVHDYIALGHYHLWGDQGNHAWYAGATERMGWGDEKVEPGYLLVTLGEGDGQPEVEHVPLPARPMRSLAPIEGRDGGEERGARELADLVRDRLAAMADPAAMVRVELRDVPRPTLRAAQELVGREAEGLAWLVLLHAPGEALGPGAGELEEGEPIEVRTLFDAFVDEGLAEKVYDPPFAERFRATGGAALDAAIRDAEEAGGEEGAA